MPFPRPINVDLSLPPEVSVPERVWDATQRVMELVYDWCHDGTLTPEQVEQIAAAYRGQ